MKTSCTEDVCWTYTKNDILIDVYLQVHIYQHLSTSTTTHLYQSMDRAIIFANSLHQRKIRDARKIRDVHGMQDPGYEVATICFILSGYLNDMDDNIGKPDVKMVIMHRFFDLLSSSAVRDAMYTTRATYNLARKFNNKIEEFSTAPEGTSSSLFYNTNKELLEHVLAMYPQVDPCELLDPAVGTV